MSNQKSVLSRWPPASSSNSDSNSTNVYSRKPQYGQSKPAVGSVPMKKKTVAQGAGVNQGSLAHFLGKELGVKHTGRSTGMMKSRLDTSDDASSRTYHANKPANQGMAKAFAQMVVGATRDASTGAVVKPSQLKKKSDGPAPLKRVDVPAKKRSSVNSKASECVRSDCTAKKFPGKPYCASCLNKARQENNNGQEENGDDDDDDGGTDHNDKVTENNSNNGDDEDAVEEPKEEPAQEQTDSNTE